MAKVTFRGLIDLAESEFSTRAGEITIEDNAITNLSFEGDWVNMPVDTAAIHGAGYAVPLRQRRERSRSLVPVDNRYSCEVESQKQASTYHPSLTGTAKVLSCTKDTYQYATNLYVYLEAYGVFVQTQYVTKNVLGEWTIEVVES